MTDRPKIDLHLHSNASDGSEDPDELVRAAVAHGVTTLAITDHDTTAGWAAATAAMTAMPAAVRLVRGTEFSTNAPDGRGGRVSAHLLGYLFDPEHPAILADHARLRDERRRRIAVMTERLRADGYAVDPEAIAARTDAPVGRPHLALSLMELGWIDAVGEAFAEGGLLHKSGPYYEPKQDTPIEDAIDMITAAGGVSVWAHPLGRRRGDVVESSVFGPLRDRGLTGIEVDHQDHVEPDRETLRGVARELDLVVTGSSDWHGANKTIPIAAETTDPDELERLLAGATGAEVVVGSS